jgi:Domain of unknown function (DUF4145)
MDAAKLAGIKDRPWSNATPQPSQQWKCGYCNHDVGSNTGYAVQAPGSGLIFYIRFCGNCNGPTFFTPEGDYSPGVLPGSPVQHVPDELAPLFAEARASAAAGAYTSAVLTCRKMLMHIAVLQGAKAGQSFFDYVTYLAKEGYVPPNGKVWVDYIRLRSNEANHEIVLMTKEDALALVTFVEMLLRFIYELPNLAPAAPGDSAPAAP